MGNIYTQNGLQEVINASGRMTILGVSTVSEGVGRSLAEAAGHYVVMDDLYQYAGRKIGSMIGAQDACVTSSASAGIALAVASLICGDSLERVQHLYDLLPETPRREVILLKGQNVDFGAPVGEMLQVGGGQVKEVGYANKSTLGDIRSAVSDRTLAILFVKSHHCVQKEMVDARSVIELANSLGVPCIVDAAAEEDLSVYNRMGADFVCYSGAKAIEGPTSGFVACKTEQLAANMRLQYKGIGRTMKVGKENIMGLLTGIEEYLAGKHQPAVTDEQLKAFAGEIGAVPGCRAQIVQDEAGRMIYRCKITFDKAFGRSAEEVVEQLKKGDPAIYTRDYQANLGSIAIDPRPLHSAEELRVIYNSIKQLYKGD